MYEEAFARMKRAAGVSEIDEVVHRYDGGEGNLPLEMKLAQTVGSMN